MKPHHQVILQTDDEDAFTDSHNGGVDVEEKQACVDVVDLAAVSFDVVVDKGGRRGSNFVSLFERHITVADVVAALELAPAAKTALDALEAALRESGCDGDLCTHKWHDDARTALAAGGRR